MLVLKENPIVIESTKKYQNDCTIIALSNAFNVTYDLALLILQRVVPTRTGYKINDTNLPKKRFSSVAHYQKFLRIFSDETKRFKVVRSKPVGTSTKTLANNLKGTHILLEPRHAKVLYEGVIIDTHDRMHAPIHYSYEIKPERYLPFLKDVCNKLDVSFEEHTLKQSLSDYIKNFNMDDYMKAKMAKEAEMQDKKTFVELSKKIGLNPKAYGAEVTINGELYKIVKIETRNRKMPVIARSENKSRGYKLSPMQAEHLIGL